MTERSALPRLLLLVAAAVVAALGGMGYLVVRTQREMAGLREQLAKSGGTTTAAPAPSRDREAVPRVGTKVVANTPAANTPAADTALQQYRKRVQEASEPAQPKMPEAKRFVERVELDGAHWQTLTGFNAYWKGVLEKAATEGEDALPDKLDYVAKQRELKLRLILGAPEIVAEYKDFEGSLHENRVSYKSKDGKVYEAVPFE